MPLYFKVSDYVQAVRNFLQDEVQPYRYTDQTLVNALNGAMFEIARIRPDLFLDFKYQQPLPKKSQPNDGIPQLFNSTNQNMTVPIPSTVFMAVQWYMAGLAQFYDVDDTQDARAAAFHQKFIGALMTLAA